MFHFTIKHAEVEPISKYCIDSAKVNLQLNYNSNTQKFKS